MTVPWSRVNRRALLVAGALAIAVAGGLSMGSCADRPTTHTQTAPLTIRRVEAIPLPGSDSRFDYEALDPAAGRLFIDHMGDGTLLELDTRTSRVVATVTGLPSVTGVIVVPALHRVFASAAAAGEIVTIDENTARVLARTPAGQFPDGLVYVGSTNQVWASDETGGVETVIDASNSRRVATVQLGGEAGNVRYDPTIDRVFVDVQTRDELALINPHSRMIIRRVPVSGCDHDHGLLLAAGRAYVACDGNNQLIILRLPALTALGRVPVGDGPDVLAFDPTRRLLYVAAESGVLTIVDARSATGRVDYRAWLADNAHVVAVDPTTGRAYFPVPDIGRGRPGLLVTVPAKSTRP